MKLDRLEKRIADQRKCISSLQKRVKNQKVELKKKDYTILSKYLQKVESSFVINGFVRDCMDERPDMFVATIHDSVLVETQNLNWAREQFIKQFEPIGLIPTLREKTY